MSMHDSWFCWKINHGVFQDIWFLRESQPDLIRVGVHHSTLWRMLCFLVVVFLAALFSFLTSLNSFKLPLLPVDQFQNSNSLARLWLLYLPPLGCWPTCRAISIRWHTMYSHCSLECKSFHRYHVGMFQCYQGSTEMSLFTLVFW